MAKATYVEFCLRVICDVCGGPVEVKEDVDMMWGSYLKVEPCEACMKKAKKAKK